MVIIGCSQLINWLHSKSLLLCFGDTNPSLMRKGETPVLPIPTGMLQRSNEIMSIKALSKL